MRLKFFMKFIKLIKITNCLCGRICNGCDVAVLRAEYVHTQELTNSLRMTLRVSKHVGVAYL